MPEVDIVRLTGVTQPYAWGTTRGIADVLGRTPADAVANEPVAEYWLGAHDSAPALLADGRRLDTFIDADPEGTLGTRIADRFGELPFLLKLLSAAKPLSIQAHPSLDQAREGYLREQASRIAIDAPNRVYRDPNHKPELICALTAFRALCGFRSLDGTRELFEALGPGVEHVVERLEAPGSDAEVLADTLAWILRAADAEVVRSCVEACRRLDRPGFSAEAQAAMDAATHFPDDPGVIVTLLLNFVTLEPGEAIFLDAGNLHAYLSGTGVEVMANSNNVVRGGLTPKHVDIDELLDVVDCTPIEPAVQRPDDWNHRYRSEVSEFALHKYEVGDGRVVAWQGDAPAIAIVTSGNAELNGDPFPRGDAAFLPAGTPARITGQAQVHLATTN